LIAEEWEAQGETILLPAMPATRLAWTTLDRIPGARDEVVAEVAKFAASDLLCYFADGPAELANRQQRHWGPVIAWAKSALGLEFHRVTGLMHQPQPPATVEAVRALAAAENDFGLAGLAFATALFGSTILALALRRGELSAEAAFELSRLDEIFQEERWGVDAEAAARTDIMARDAVTAERWFRALPAA
jgi:chaperone required for assembly of F1-ATPase